MFQLVSSYAPAGDQPQAIATLVDGLQCGYEAQTLFGVTGSGKTFTVANIIQETQRPTLVISHNKTLAAQVYNELREFFPHNAVEYFISYYDYYQPEAYIPKTDTYIEKTSSINEEIDRLRHSATRSLFERRDVIVVASVSCIYGLGLPENYLNAALRLRVGMTMDRRAFLHELVRIQYQRNDVELKRSTFRVRGDRIDIQPAYEECTVQLGFFGDELETIRVLEATTGNLVENLNSVVIYPAKHYVANADDLDRACEDIRDELRASVAHFKATDRHVEAQRLQYRTSQDLDQIKTLGYCNGIENYSRILENRPPGSAPKTLVDYFPGDFLLIIDESHVTLPQLRGMFHGDRSRKDTLIDYGFRLPCARDNRPLNYDEFSHRIGQRIYVSATPGKEELENSSQVTQQIIRPTGLLDPEIFVRPTQHQVDDLQTEIRLRIDRQERVLITTLTKRMAEDLSEYYQSLHIKVRYLHSDIKPLERIEIIRDLRLGTFDVLIGVNLLREGLDIPEVSLVVIMDADKEGFLRSESSLIQTIGRAARNACGQVILYADRVTDSMQKAIDETARRRALQMAFNTEHGLTPTTIRKSIANGLLDLIGSHQQESQAHTSVPSTPWASAIQEASQRKQRGDSPVADSVLQEIATQIQQAMHEAARLLDFEKAALLRDQLTAVEALVEKVP